MKKPSSNSTESPGVRTLAPIAHNAVIVDEAVVRCAQEFARAFAKNPGNPGLRAIAQAAGCSRNSVKGHLAEAQNKNLLTLMLRLPKHETLSSQLAEKYGLAEAVVSGTAVTWVDQESVRAALAAEVMGYLARACSRLAEVRKEQSIVRIGLDGGMTLYKAVYDASVAGFASKLSYELVPLLFGPLEGAKYTAMVVAQLLASKLEALHVKIKVEDPFLIKAGKPGSKGEFTITLRNRAVVPQIDLCFVGIGSRRAGLFRRQDVSGTNGRELRNYFGDILNQPFDRRGDPVESLTQGRPVLLGLSDLSELAKSSSALVIGAAGGIDKVDAIRTVLERKYVSVLITDNETASALMRA